MRALKFTFLGFVAGTALGALAGVAMPETRSQPIAIGVIAVCGSIFGTLIAFVAHMLTRSDEEREREIQADVAGAARGRGGIVGGVLIVVLAIVWFVIGLAAGRIYFYPPVLLVFGLISIARGLFAGPQEETA